MKIGIDLGGSHISVGLINNIGEILYQKEYIFSQKEKFNMEENIIKIIHYLIKELLEKNHLITEQIELIGIGSPGEISKGQIKHAVNLNINKFDITKKLKKYFNTKIIVKNDGVCAAACEKEYGSLKEYDNCVFLCLGTGIGGACFMNGKILKRGKRIPFEIGHMSIDKHGILCSCGNKGCFEKYASMKVLKDNIIDNFNFGKDAHGKVILDLIEKEKNNPDIESILNNYIKDLVLGIVNIINLFEPDAISIGGSFVHYKEVLYPLLVKEVKNSKTLRNYLPEIKLATYGNEAGIIGATIEV